MFVFRPSPQTSSHSPYGRVSHCTVFISSLLPTGPLTYTHFFLLKKYQGKIKTDVVSTETGYNSFFPGGEPLALLRREGKIAPREVRSWVKNQDLRIQRPLTWALRWISHTLWCFGHPRAAQPTNEIWRFSEKNRPPFLINNPWQGHFPMRTPACISGNSNTEVKCRVTVNIHFLSKCNENITPYEHSSCYQIGWMGCNW